MGNVINWPWREQSSSREARSTDSAVRKRGRRACVLPFRLRDPKTRAGYARAGTTSQPVDVADLGLEPSQTGHPKSVKSDLCPESLAFRELIMDDKSMQPWTNLQLTLPEPPRTIRVVGRPPDKLSPAAYRAAFFRRVRTAREFYTEEPGLMAEALGIPAGTYTRYETRTMMPHHLIPRFCQLTRRYDGLAVLWAYCRSCPV
jgi:hypothetical protein